MPPVDRAEYEHTVAEVRAVLEEKAFKYGWETGERIVAEGLEKIITYALTEAPQDLSALGREG